MRKVEGFEYYIDEKGTVLKETSEGYKVIKQESYRYYLFKNRKKYSFNKCELVAKTYFGEKLENYYLLIKDGNTKNISVNNLEYVKWEEIGKRVEGFENYLVSSDGEFYCIKNDKILKQPKHFTKRGYIQVKLRKNNKVYSRLLHRLVAQSFLLSVDNKMDVIHLNGNKEDNRVENLGWCTGKDNISSISFYEASINNNTICSLFSGDEFIDNFESISK